MRILALPICLFILVSTLAFAAPPKPLSSTIPLAPILSIVRSKELTLEEQLARIDSIFDELPASTSTIEAPTFPDPEFNRNLIDGLFGPESRPWHNDFHFWSKGLNNGRPRAVEIASRIVSRAAQLEGGRIKFDTSSPENIILTSHVLGLAPWGDAELEVFLSLDPVHIPTVLAFAVASDNLSAIKLIARSKWAGHLLERRFVPLYMNEETSLLEFAHRQSSRKVFDYLIETSKGGDMNLGELFRNAENTDEQIIAYIRARVTDTQKVLGLALSYRPKKNGLIRRLVNELIVPISSQDLFQAAVNNEVQNGVLRELLEIGKRRGVRLAIPPSSYTLKKIWETQVRAYAPPKEGKSNGARDWLKIAAEYDFPMMPERFSVPGTGFWYSLSGGYVWRTLREIVEDAGDTEMLRIINSKRCPKYLRYKRRR